MTDGAATRGHRAAAGKMKRGVCYAVRGIPVQGATFIHDRDSLLDFEVFTGSWKAVYIVHGTDRLGLGWPGLRGLDGRLFLATVVSYRSRSSTKSITWSLFESVSLVSLSPDRVLGL